MEARHGDVSQNPNYQLAAEALVSVTGLFPDGILSPKDGRAAESVPKEFRAAVQAFLDQSKPARFSLPKKIDAGKIADELSKGIDVADAGQLVSSLAVPELGEAYLEVLKRARGYLLAHWPRLSRDTLSGPRDLPPGPVENGRLASLYAIVDDPSRILDDLRSGTLTGEQAEAFKACYPSLYQMINMMIWDQAAKKWPPDKEASAPWRIERVVRVLLGLPPELSLSQAAPKKTAAPPKVQIDFDSMKTPAQKLASR